MPAPLEMPENRTSSPASDTPPVYSLGKVSVVMMPRAASCQPAGFSLPTASGIPARMRSMGNCTPITPVLMTSVVESPLPMAFSRVSAIMRALAMPSGPVQALAQPLLTTTP